MADTYEINELLPKLDCGWCRNPRCMTFARRVLQGAQRPEECSFLSKENLLKIQEVTEGKEPERKHPHPNIEQDTIEIHPCTEDGKVTLETQLRSKFMDQNLYGDFFDQYQLCTNLGEIDIFDSVKCSPKMGYAFAEIKGKRIHIFKTGKIIMRRAEDKEDALGTFSKINKILLPAKICSCDNILGDCFGGACEVCSDEVCVALLDMVEPKGKNHNLITINDVFEKLGLEENDDINENFKMLGEIVDEIRKIDEVSMDESYKNRIDDIFKKINENCVKTILLDHVSYRTMVALAQYGLGMDLSRVLDGFLSMKKENMDETFENAKELFFDACHAFEERNIENSKAVGVRYKKFISELKEKPLSPMIAKISANGFYISRVLGKPVPDVGAADMDSN